MDYPHFIEVKKAYECYGDDERDESTELKRTIRQGQDGYWRFYPAQGVSLNCKACRELAQKLSELNT